MWSEDDLSFAVKLQQQFDKENQERGQPKNAGGGRKSNWNNMEESPNKSFDVGRSDLELTDPTPNVHALFVQFDKKFFWSSLSSVVVRWSKRMYSCAGICRYQGRGGLCDIALSEPLLKLRSRKELVETLLHEMIHAYLFLTVRDRDRDGHGPNFQMHMHRINKMANINITIYHSFHNEVQLYKVHWWRCNGVCQNQRPFFGIVRRTCNRAPGPNDIWWQRHKSVCNGTFIKIKEPEVVKKKSNESNPKQLSKQPLNTTGDIRKYLGSKKIDAVDQKPPPPKKVKIDDSTSSKYPRIIEPKNTFIPNTAKQQVPTPNVKDIKNEQSTSNTDCDQNVIDTVRNHWAKKYQNTNQNIIDIPTTLTEDTEKTKPSKKTPVDSNNDPSTSTEPIQIIDLTKSDFFDIDSNQFSDCPICNTKVKMIDINNHLDGCLQESVSYSDCPVCDLPVITSDLKNHISECLRNAELENTFGDNDTRVKDGTDSKQCPACDKLIESIELSEHLENCLNTTFTDDNTPSTSQNTISSLSSDEDEDEEPNDEGFDRPSNHEPCPCCCELIDEKKMNEHIQNCLCGMM